jgi:hypothetical protein
MSSNFTASNLRTGLTIPIKLRQIMERPPTGQGQSVAFHKLAELITSNFVARKASKENQPLPKPKEGKNIRINSLKQPSLRPASIPHQHQCFTEFFEYFASNREGPHESPFRPYRQQQTYLRDPQTSPKPRKKASTLSKKSEAAEGRCKDARSIFGEWEIEQENSNFSILLKSHQE